MFKLTCPSCDGRKVLVVRDSFRQPSVPLETGQTIRPLVVVERERNCIRCGGTGRIIRHELPEQKEVTD